MTVQAIGALRLVSEEGLPWKGRKPLADRALRPSRYLARLPKYSRSVSLCKIVLDEFVPSPFNPVVVRTVICTEGISLGIDGTDKT